MKPSVPDTVRAVRSLLVSMAFCGLAAVGSWATAGAGSEDPKPQRNTTPGDTSKAAAEDRSSRDTARSKGEITFDDLKFEIERGGKFERSMLTKEIEELNKKDVRIRGYILPASVFKQTGIEEFVLVRDNMECCFGPGAALYDCILITMAPGQTAEYTIRPVAVEGVFDFEHHAPLGETLAIFKMTADSAQ